MTYRTCCAGKRSDETRSTQRCLRMRYGFGASTWTPSCLSNGVSPVTCKAKCNTKVLLVVVALVNDNRDVSHVTKNQKRVCCEWRFQGPIRSVKARSPCAKTKDKGKKASSVLSPFLPRSNADTDDFESSDAPLWASWSETRQAMSE